MEIYVVRHGQTDYNIKQVFQGHIDIPLNETGKKQAQEIALRFKDIDIDMILVSPLQRTIQTAEYISQVTDIPITVEERIIERFFWRYGRTSK
ncbi:MAG: histidine phosphatase family protein [Clostridia bacterium]